MARGDAFIVQNVHDALAGNASLTVRPANGVEVCITSMLVAGVARLRVVSPSDGGSSQNYTHLYAFSNDADSTSGAMKVFVDYTDYLQVFGNSSSDDRLDAHISGIVTKA